MIDYALASSAVLIFLVYRNWDSAVVAVAFAGALSIFEVFDAGAIAGASELSGVYCFSAMASVWLTAGVYVNNPQLSTAIISTGLFVGVCGIMDAFMPMGSPTTVMLFDFYPSVMISTQLLILTMAGRNGIDPLYTYSGALSLLGRSGRNSFEASGS